MASRPISYNQEAHDAECAVLVRALNLAAERQQRKKLERLTIFRMPKQPSRACRRVKSAQASNTPDRRARP